MMQMFSSVHQYHFLLREVRVHESEFNHAISVLIETDSANKIIHHHSLEWSPLEYFLKDRLGDGDVSSSTASNLAMTLIKCSGVQ